jgi:hypothetical protein
VSGSSDSLPIYLFSLFLANTCISKKKQLGSILLLRLAELTLASNAGARHTNFVGRINGVDEGVPRASHAAT